MSASLDNKPIPPMYQSVWIVFEDGTTAGFSGVAVIFPGDEGKLIKEIKFTPPKLLPPGYTLEMIDKNENT